MSTRLFGGFVLALAVLLTLGGSAAAQRKNAVGTDGVVPLNFNGNALSTPTLFLDAVGNRVCGLTATSPVTTSCVALPTGVTIPAGTPVVALNPFDTNLHYFVIGTGVGTTTLCVVTSTPTVGTTVCGTF
jgi:hypothetical protein